VYAAALVLIRHLLFDTGRHENPFMASGLSAAVAGASTTNSDLAKSGVLIPPELIANPAAATPNASAAAVIPWSPCFNITTRAGTRLVCMPGVCSVFVHKPMSGRTLSNHLLVDLMWFSASQGSYSCQPR